LRVNDRIRVSQIRLIDEKNTQLGIVDTAEALNRAREAGVDLVEVSPTAQPPVCRLMDYGKWLYEQKRKEHIAHKKQHAVVLKEIRLRPKIDPHDQTIKLNHARKFLEKGHRVQFTMLFRGREMVHIDHGYALMEDISRLLQDVAKVEKGAMTRGRRMVMIIVPK